MGLLDLAHVSSLVQRDPPIPCKGTFFSPTITIITKLSKLSSAVFLQTSQHLTHRLPKWLQMFPSTSQLSVSTQLSTQYLEHSKQLVNRHPVPLGISFLIYLLGLCLSLLILWAWSVFTVKKTTAETTRRRLTTEAIVMPMTKGSDTNSSQCWPRYHQFEPTRHL